MLISHMYMHNFAFPGRQSDLVIVAIQFASQTQQSQYPGYI